MRSGEWRKMCVTPQVFGVFSFSREIEAEFVIDRGLMQFQARCS